MSSNKQDLGLAGRLKGGDDRLTKLERSYWKGRHRLVMLQNRVAAMTPLTGQSTVAFTNLDLTALTSAGSSDISDNTIAVVLNVAFKDSGSAATYATAELRSNGATQNGALIVPAHHINSQFNYGQGIIAVDENYILEYAINASGANTAALSIYVVGYIEQLAKVV